MSSAVCDSSIWLSIEEVLVSLFALHGAATGVVTEGLVYPMRGEALAPGSSRGLSNVFADREARVSVESGVVVAMRPSASR